MLIAKLVELLTVFGLLLFVFRIFEGNLLLQYALSVLLLLSTDLLTRYVVRMLEKRK